jgi:hypothetical protein
MPIAPNFVDYPRKSRPKNSAPARPQLVAEPPIAWAAQTLAARDLQQKTVAPLRCVVPGLLPEGVTLLAGRSKLGKSWLALDLAIAIAGGRATLGNLQPQTGDVLHLALEDGEHRLQRRLATLLPGEDVWPTRLSLATQWRRANEGGLADIAEWCRSVLHPVAVVIDGLDRFRGLKGERGAQIRKAIEELQRLAREHAVAVIIVHHERTRSGGDPVDMIAGPAGIGGAADTVLVLKREARGVVLYARGRDIEDSETILVFDRASCRWRPGAPAEAAKSELRSAVVQALAQAVRKPLSVPEIVEATGGSRGAIDTLLHRLVGDGEVERAGRGRYRIAWNHPQRPPIDFVWADGTHIARL